MTKKLIILFLLAPAFAIALSGIRVYYYISVWEYSGKTIHFEIKPGEGFASINGRLKRKQIISNSRIFHRYSQFNGIMTKFKAGRYQIKSRSNMLQVIDNLLLGKSINISVTFPEGKNLYQVAQILEDNQITNAKDFIKQAKNYKFVQSLNIPSETVEGYLYPDTYHFNKNTSPKSVIKKMTNLFKSKTKKLNMTQGKLTPFQVITLASIVEKETGASWERPIIAGVFLNRLKKRMRLQSDPTTIYGIYESFNGNLRKKDLRKKTPYNTYKISALPIGPISNPGLESLKAVISPKKHNFLYFVSMNDGTHIFSKNYRDHRRGVKKYQKSSKFRKGRSWRDLKKK